MKEVKEGAEKKGEEVKEPAAKESKADAKQVLHLPQIDWYFIAEQPAPAHFIAEQPAPAPHLAHPEGCAALCIVLVTVPRVSQPLLREFSGWIRSPPPTPPPLSSSERNRHI